MATTAAIHVERRSDAVSVHDLRAMLRLEGELSELAPGSDAQRQHVLTGLGDLIGATLRVWLRVEDLHGRPRLAQPQVVGLGDQAGLAWFWRYMEEQERWPDPSLACLPGHIDADERVYLRQHLVDDRTWYRAAHVSELRRALDVDSCICTLRLDADRRASASMTLHRAWGGRGFTERERQLVELFHHESRALRVASWPTPPSLADSLPPRLRETLAALARGLSEKQIAAELGLSAHTVHDYVKALHRRLGVQSRGELLARCAQLPHA